MLECSHPESTDFVVNETSPERSICWACDAVLTVPVISGRKAPTYKCGWCGALNPAGPDPTNPGLRRAAQPWFGKPGSACAESSCARLCFRLLGGVVNLLVCAIVALIGIVGTYFVLWDLLGTGAFWAHIVVSSFLTFQILSNYGLAVVSSPGDVDAFYVLKPEPQAFTDHRYCHRCKNHKPPDTHHCKVCGKCVVGMDHHCPMLSNCVGRGNMRHFLLFLLWVVVAMFYAIPWLAFAINRQRALAMKVWARHARLHSYNRLKIMLRVAVDLPGSMCIAVYLCVACLVVLVMVGGLCIRHFWLAAAGTTYIGQLQGEHRSAAGTFHNLQQVFGGHPATWVFPRFGRAPIVQNASKAAKGA